MIVQKNLYLPGQDLTNLAQNVDYNRYQDFKGTITVNFGTVPATVTVKVGTILEVNGNLYAIETADYVFQMDNATHNYLTFTDNPAVDFGSAAAIGTYTAAKQGYYQAGNLIRTLPFYIDQVKKEYSRLMDEPLNDIRPRMKKWTRVMVYLSNDQAYAAMSNAIMNFDAEVYDELSEFNVGTYTFTATESGFYLITLNATAYLPGAAFFTSYIKLNAAFIAESMVQYTAGGGHPWGSSSITLTRYLQAGDTVCFWGSCNAGAPAGYILAHEIDGGSPASSGMILRLI